MQSQDSYNNLFNALNSARHIKHIQCEFVAPFLWRNIPAEKMPVTTTCEFWLLTDVLGTIENLETKNYQTSFTIGNILREYAPTKMLPKQKFELTDNHLHIIKVTDESMTAEISRYAAWAIMKEIGNHYNTTFQQEYFLAPTPHFEQTVTHTNELSRIDARKKFQTHKHNLDGILGKLIHQNYQFGKFYNLLYSWLFIKDDKSIGNATIYDYYKIPKGASLTDYMNYKLLPLYATALENIANRYNNLQHQTYDNLYTISKKEMGNVRQQFIRSHDSTKRNLSPVSIDTIIADRKRREQKFIATHAYEKIK